MLNRNVYKVILSFVDSVRDHCALSQVCKFFYENKKDLTADLEEKTEDINYCLSFYTVIRGTNIRHGLYKRKIETLTVIFLKEIIAVYDYGKLLSVTYLLTDGGEKICILYKDDGMAYPCTSRSTEEMRPFSPKEEIWDTMNSKVISHKEFIEDCRKQGDLSYIREWAPAYFEDLAKILD